MCARHGRGAKEICLSEKGALAKKLGNTDLDKRSFISKRYHLLANERSAVATHEQAAQFTVVFWRFFLWKKEKSSLHVLGAC